MGKMGKAHGNAGRFWRKDSEPERSLVAPGVQFAFIVVLIQHELRWISGGRAGQWLCGQFQVAQDFLDDVALLDGGDEAHAPLAFWADQHIGERPAKQVTPLDAQRLGQRRRDGVGLLKAELLQILGDLFE